MDTSEEAGTGQAAEDASANLKVPMHVAFRV